MSVSKSDKPLNERMKVGDDNFSNQWGEYRFINAGQADLNGGRT
jgi:hypothetical protein